MRPAARAGLLPFTRIVCLVALLAVAACVADLPPRPNLMVTVKLPLGTLPLDGAARQPWASAGRPPSDACRDFGYACP